MTTTKNAAKNLSNMEGVVCNTNIYTSSLKFVKESSPLALLLHGGEGFKMDKEHKESLTPFIALGGIQ